MMGMGIDAEESIGCVVSSIGNMGPVCVYEAEGVLTDLSPVNPEKISLAAYILFLQKCCENKI